MAEDKNNEEEPNERKNEFFDDDEDFGLPDLEYDELDDFADEEEEIDEPLEEELEEVSAIEDDQEEEAVEESVFEADDEEEEVAAATEEIEEEVSAETDSAELEISEDEIEIDEDDLDISDDDLEGLDLEGLDLDDISEEDLDLEGEEADFYEEESFEEFDSDDAAAAAAAASTHAAGEGYKNLADKENKGVEFKYSESQSRASFTRIVVFGTVIIALLGFLLFWLYGGKSEEVVAEEPPKQEVKPEPRPEPKPEPKEEVQPEPEPEPVRNEPIAAPAGEITRLSAKTSNSYIIIGSFIDGDLAEDYAQELAGLGQSPTIIPPFDDHRFYRVAIASFSSFDQANGALVEFKAEYGEDIWALRY